METNNQADQLAVEINDENVAVRLGMPRKLLLYINYSYITDTSILSIGYV